MGYAHHRIILNEEGIATDYEFIEVNQTFEQLSGCRAHLLEGKSARAQVTDFEKVNGDWITFFGEVATTGGQKEFDHYSKSLGKWYRGHVYSTEQHYFTTLYVECGSIRKVFETEKQLQNINNALNESTLVSITDPKGIIVSANKQFCKISGYSQQELIGQNHNIVNSGFHDKAFWVDLWKTISGGKVWRGEIKNRSKNGSIYWVSSVINPIFDEVGNITHYMSIRQDITDRKLVEAEMLTSKEQYQSLVNNIPGITYRCLFDKDWTMLFISTQVDNITGYTAEELLHNSEVSYGVLIHPHDQALVTATVEAGVENDTPWEMEYRVRHKDGSYRWVYEKGTSIKDASGQVQYLDGFILDITARKNIQNALAASEERYHRALSGTGAGLWDWDMVNNTVYFSLQWKAMLGYEDHEVTNDFYGWRNLWHPDEVTYLEKKISDYIEGRVDSYEAEHRLLAKDGTWRWIIARGYIEKNPSGKPIRWTGTHVDFTERKRAEQEVITQQQILQRIGEIAKVGGWEYDVLNDELRWTQVTYDIHELSGDFVPTPGQGISFYKEGESREKISRVFTAAVQEGKPFDEELIILTTTGKEKWVRAIAEPVLDNGKCIKVTGVFQDIDDQKKAREALKTSEQTLKTYIDASPLGIFVADLKGQYLDANKAGEILTGYSCHDLLSLTIADVFDQKHVEKGLSIVQSTLETGNGEGICLARKKDGTPYWLWMVSRKVNDEFILAFCQDVSERIHAEEELAAERELLKILMTVSNEFINVPLELTDKVVNVALDTLGKFANNDRAYIFLYDHEAKVCSNIYEWCAEGIEPQITQLQQIPFEAIPDWVEAHFAGKSIHVNDVFALPPDNNIRQILEPQDVQSILTLPMMDGPICMGFVGFDAVKSKHIFSDKEQQLLKLFALMLVNIFKRNAIQNELTSSKLQAEAASKAKSEFLANMSHEIRTPLNGVIGFTELLKGTPLSLVQKEYVDNANVSGHALLGIINDILDFSKIEAGMLHLERIKTDMVELLENSVDIVKYQAEKKGIELLLGIDPNMPRFAMADPIRLKQVLANLLGNAVKFTEKGEVVLNVQYEAVERGKGRLSFFVRDTGIGISESQMNKLFKAFSQADSSTTRKFGGTGLGLIISDMIIKEMGGKIQVDSKPGVGSTFSFDIITEVEEAKDYNVPSINRIKRCLIIDDNANNRLILEKMLSKWGIVCESCDNGLTALKLLQTSKSFDVIICDYNMPYMDGLETIRIIREKLKLTPDKQPIIVLHSSSDDAELHRRCDALGVRFRLTKPVKSGDLFAYLCQVHEADKNHPETIIPIDTAPKATVPGGVSILIAEDVEMNMVMITALILRIYPDAVLHKAKNGLQVIQMANEVVPDLILMDVQMPEMDGLEATRQIRSMETGTGRHVPIIALTAGAFKEEREKCFAAGMDDFLTKPVEKEKIVSVLEKYLLAKGRMAEGDVGVK